MSDQSFLHWPFLMESIGNSLRALINGRVTIYRPSQPTSMMTWTARAKRSSKPLVGPVLQPMRFPPVQADTIPSWT